MGIFGWSLPPGCSTLPGEEPWWCEICGQCEDDCICPECPVCGEWGNPDCYHRMRHDGPHMKMGKAQKLLANWTERAQVAEDRALGDDYRLGALEDSLARVIRAYDQMGDVYGRRNLQETVNEARKLAPKIQEQIWD